MLIPRKSVTFISMRGNMWGLFGRLRRVYIFSASNRGSCSLSTFSGSSRSIRSETKSRQLGKGNDDHLTGPWRPVARWNQYWQSWTHLHRWGRWHWASLSLCHPSPGAAVDQQKQRPGLWVDQSQHYAFGSCSESGRLRMSLCPVLGCNEYISSASKRREEEMEKRVISEISYQNVKPCAK